MQAVKEKLSDMNAMRKAKSEAKAEEKAEKELAKAGLEVAHEVRKAREAEAEMDLHVTKAAHKAETVASKHLPKLTHEPPVGGTSDYHGHFIDGVGGDPMMETMGPYNTNMAGAPPSGRYL